MFVLFVVLCFVYVWIMINLVCFKGLVCYCLLWFFCYLRFWCLEGWFWWFVVLFTYESYLCSIACCVCMYMLFTLFELEFIVLLYSVWFALDLFVFTLVCLLVCVVYLLFGLLYLLFLCCVFCFIYLVACFMWFTWWICLFVALYGWFRLLVWVCLTCYSLVLVIVWCLDGGWVLSLFWIRYNSVVWLCFFRLLFCWVD